MILSEKLNKLILLTNISNAQLAREMHVDASLISRWRNSSRSPLKNTYIMDQLTTYFAEKIIDENRFDELKSIIEKDCTIIIEREKIKESLLEWLNKDIAAPDELIQGSWRVSSEPGYDGPTRPPSPEKEAGQTLFVGQAGRLQALDLLLQYIQEKKSQNGELLIYCDEDAEWMEAVTHHVMPFLAVHPEIALQFHQVRLIIPDTLGPREVMGAVNFVIPFLRTSLFQLYSARRSGRDIFQSFIVVLQGIGAITSSSYFNSDPVTVLHTDEEYVKQLQLRLSALAANSVALLDRKDRVAFGENLALREEFMNFPEDILFMGNMTLASSLPFDLLQEFVSMFIGTLASIEETRRKARQYISAFETFLSKYKAVYCTPLFSPQDVESGAVSLPTLPRFIGNRILVTPERYVKILKRTAELMENFKNFTFQVIDELSHDYSVGIRPSYSMFITTNDPQPTMYISDWPIVLRSMYDSLSRKYEAIPPDLRKRSANLERLRAQIQLFEEYLMKKEDEFGA